MGTSSSAYELNHEYAWELKVTTMFYRINKTQFVPSLCIGDNHGTVLE